MSRTIVDALEDKKGENILLLDIQEISDFTDYFVICSGTSPRMLRTLAEAAVEKVKKEYGMSPPLEGAPEDGWLLVDYGDVILHIFSTNRRHYYQLEDLWGEGKVVVHLQ